MIVAIVAGVGGYWLIVTALVRRDKGWVGITDFRRAQLRLIGGIALATFAVSDALTPAIKRTLRVMSRWGALMDPEP